jgi:UDP-GlcNAc:undecaprenyl-phosphate GlcNAc-1-phosphate transferase
MNIYDFLAKDISVLINFFFYFFFSFLIFQTLISKKINRIMFFKKTLINNIQNIHTKKTSRLGGLGISFSIFAIALYQYYIGENKILFQILICSLPLMIIALTEDLIQNINPVLRLVGIFVSPLLCLYIFRGSLPSVEIFIIESFINSPYISPIFFTICLVGFINGTNFIDGTNGLASFTILSSLLCLLFLAITINDTEISQIIIYIIAVLFGFMFFNYPLGKIFLGDLGAYLLAFITGMITILLMGRNPELPNWSAVCILSYPVIEVIFSFSRKIYSNKNPLYPDKKHLHLKLYFTLNARIKNPVIANSFVAPFLSLIWLMPLVLLPWIYTNKFLILSAVSLQIIIYLSFYKFIPDDL